VSRMLDYPPLSLRISVTDRCQLRCVYCTPRAAGTARRSARLTFDEILRFVRAVQGRLALRKVHLTGGEPLCRPRIADLVRSLAGEGIGELALTTNGQRLTKLAPTLKRAGLRRVNVSLDSLDPQVFYTLTGGGRLADTLAGLDAALECGLGPVKLNTVVLRGYNDSEVVSLARYGLERGCHVRFLELMPIGCIRRRFARLFVSSAEVQSRLQRAFRFEPLPRAPSASSQDFRVRGDRDLEGTLGFISPESAPFCAGCTRLRLTSTGQLIACLARGTGLRVAGLLRSNAPEAMERLQEIVGALLARKQARASFGAAQPMLAVGG